MWFSILGESKRILVVSFFMLILSFNSSLASDSSLPSDHTVLMKRKGIRYFGQKEGPKIYAHVGVQCLKRTTECDLMRFFTYETTSDKPDQIGYVYYSPDIVDENLLKSIEEYLADDSFMKNHKNIARTVPVFNFWHQLQRLSYRIIFIFPLIPAIELADLATSPIQLAVHGVERLILRDDRMDIRRKLMRFVSSGKKSSPEKVANTLMFSEISFKLMYPKN